MRKIRTVILDPAVFKPRYKNLSWLAKAMGIATSYIYRVRQEERNINGKFILGATKAFPEHSLNDLFFIEERET